MRPCSEQAAPNGLFESLRSEMLASNKTNYYCAALYIHLDIYYSWIYNKTKYYCAALYIKLDINIVGYITKQSIIVLLYILSWIYFYLDI